MPKNLVPTLDELMVMLTGGSSTTGISYSTVKRRSDAEGVNPNILIDGFSEKPSVSVGFHKDTGEHKDEDGNSSGTTVAQVAFWNEYGTKTAPERSFMRSTMDEKTAEHARNFETIVTKILAGEITVEQGLGIFGEKIQADIQNKILTITDPANAPSTIKGKGSTKPLIDSKQMLNSVRWHIGGKNSAS